MDQPSEADKKPITNGWTDFFYNSKKEDCPDAIPDKCVLKNSGCKD